MISYGGCYDGLDVQLSFLKAPVKLLFKGLFHFKFKRIINKLVSSKMKKDNLANWAIAHGMYITGATTPYEFYRLIERHTVKGHLHKINQKILLLAGENDHYMPSWQHAYLVKNLSVADVTSRMFTKVEGGEQHCQVGNYDLAIGTIIKWLKEKY